MKLSILNISYPLATVGPDATGGAEQVLALVDDAAVGAGHNSLVIAPEGSQVRGTLIATRRFSGVLDEATRAQAWDEQRRAIALALERWPVDLVHMHGIDFYHYLPPPGIPCLVTLHLPPSWYPAQAFHSKRPLTWLNCVSASQERACPTGTPLLPYVPNGVPFSRLQTHVRKRGWATAIGRICPEKGYHIALDAARRAGACMILAGEVYRYPEHERYYNEDIIPRLDHLRRYVGPVGFERKRRLLSAARCLLIPSLAPETSSLVTMEALACGTPVVGFPSGALADMIENGKTGFIVHDEYEMAQAIQAAGSIHSDDCRQAARERFSSEQTARRYLELYAQLARRTGSSAHTVPAAA